MAKKRKYTKRNADYWSKKSNSEASSPFESPEWEPLETMSADEFDSIGRRKRKFSSARSSSGGTTTSRRNRITNSRTPNEYDNIANLSLPYTSSSARGGGGSIVSVREAVILCQKAYAGVGVFRNSIDVMTEFSSADIYLTKGNKQSKEFIHKWLQKINIESLAEQFFREYYRSGNVFVYKFEGKFTPEDLKKMRKLYSDAASKLKIPVKYTILNPADISMNAATSISKGLYKKVLSAYELLKIQTQSTPEDTDVYNSLSLKDKKAIKSGGWSVDGLSIDLDVKRLTTAFYKKQDYEPFATPFGWCVLGDINFKLELKKIDQAISRVVQQVVLLVTMGAEPDKGGMNKKAMTAMRTMMENETVGRTIVSDYTTEMKFVIPEIGDILNPKKYEIVNRDIQEGLQNIIFSQGEKFANQNIKVKVFLERLKEGRKIFINEFLQKEIKKVSKEMGFKSIPQANFQETDLKDDAQINRVYLRLLELGILDGNQTIKAIETGVLPEESDMEDSQKKYRDQREDGLYNPLAPAPVNDEEEGEASSNKMSNPNMTKNGRPPGTGTPQTTKNVSPIGTSSAKLFELDKLKTSFYDVCQLISKAEKSIKRKHKLKELNQEQKNVAFDIVEAIITTRDKENWSKSVSEAITKPEKTLGSFVSNKQSQEIDSIAARFNLDGFQAALLYHSEWEKE